MLKNLKQRIRNYFRGEVGFMGPMGMRGRDASDIQCPHCLTWTSDLTEEQFDLRIPSENPIYAGQKDYATLTCGECGKESDWFIGAPIMLPAGNVTLTNR